MTNTSIVISTYHRTFEGEGNRIILDFQKQNLNNFFILFDNQHNYDSQFISSKYNNSNICSYSLNDFIKYNFDKPISRSHWWGSHQNPKYFYAHFRMMVFYLNYPQYDYYWFFDDDVTFTGSLHNLLSTYDTETDDFIAIQAFKKENYIEYPRVSVINNRMSGSRGYWLNHCPGDGDNFKSTSKHFGCFFPIVRFSNRAMKYLFDIHNEGYFGYSEGFVPTSLASEGFSVSSMMDEYNNFFITNNTDCVLFHKNIRFTWEWL